MAAERPGPKVNFPLDREKLEAIKRCLDKGSLEMTITDIDLDDRGKFQAAYLWD